jgi:TRAP-type C4-dicarboxylate transport system permease small subunit
MLITTADVVGRYLFNSPILGAFELTEFLVLILIFSFLSGAQAKKEHVEVDLLFKHFPRRIRLVLDVCKITVCIVLMALVAVMSFLRALELKEAGEASPNLIIPSYPFVYFLVFGCTVLCVEYLRDLLNLFTKK